MGQVKLLAIGQLTRRSSPAARFAYVTALSVLMVRVSMRSNLPVIAR